MKKNILLIALLSSLSFGATDANMTQEHNVTQMGAQAIKKMMKTLNQAVMSAMKDGGAKKAANVCADSATDIEKSVNKSFSNITIKRATLQPRNQNNMALADEAKMLEEMMKSNSKKLLTVKVDENNYKVFKPVYMMKKCLSCHGDETTRNKDAYAIIQAKYKNDKALGYKEGDFRGAFIADINLSH